MNSRNFFSTHTNFIIRLLTSQGYKEGRGILKFTSVEVVKNDKSIKKGAKSMYLNRMECQKNYKICGQSILIC